MKKTAIATPCLAAALLLTFGARPASAVLFNPGDTLPLPGTTSAAEPQLEGTVLEDETVPFSFVGSVTGGLIRGTIQQRVVRSDLDGTLDFYWKVFNESSSAGPLGSFRIGDFMASEFNANYRIDGLGTVAAPQGHRFVGVESNYFNFSFDGNGLEPGQESKFMLMDTSATTYVKTAKMDVANPGTSLASALFPAFTPGVPEPASATLALGAAILLSAARRRQID